MSTMPEVLAEETGSGVPRVMHMTIEEFDAWVTEETPAEFIDGKVYRMSPVSRSHADLQAWLLSILSIFARQRSLGSVLGPEFQMRLPGKRFEPDLLFVSTMNAARLHPTFLEGPADLAIEIVSPESAGRDWHDKFSAYAKGGIAEYWIIDPASERCECHQLAGDIYRAAASDQGRVMSAVIPGFYLREEWLWGRVLPDALAILEEFGVLRRA